MRKSGGRAAALHIGLGAVRAADAPRYVVDAAGACFALEFGANWLRDGLVAGVWLVFHLAFFGGGRGGPGRDNAVDAGVGDGLAEVFVGVSD